MQEENALATANGIPDFWEANRVIAVRECDPYELPSGQFVERMRRTRPGSLIEMLAGCTREDCDVPQ